MAKKNPNNYCEFVADLNLTNVHRVYHDTQYGFPINNDNELFGRLLLEINQAGLSWTTILNKQKNFRKAYSTYNIQRVANYNKKNVEELLNNPGIIRNKLKVNAAIYNANKILLIQKEYGSFKFWLQKNNNISLKDWIKLFKQTFKFTGPEITREFLTSTGILKGAHIISCPTFKNLIKV